MNFTTMGSVQNSSTSSNGSSFDLPKDYILVERIIEAAILSVIFVVAVTGNVMLWIVIFRRKSLRTTSNALILCLSSADLLVSVINMPVTIFTILRGRWIFGEPICQFYGFLNMVTFIGSVMSLGAISINRYILIVHPNKFRKAYTKRNTALHIAGVWLLSFSLASPPLLGWASYGYLEGQSFCFCQWTDDVAYTFFMVGVCFGGPCSVMSYCYTKILLAFKNSQRTVSQNSMANRRGSIGSAKDNCLVRLRNKIETNHNRRRSLPHLENSNDRTLTTQVECGCYGNDSRTRLATTGMIRKNRPVTTFQPLTTQGSKGVSSNANNAISSSSGSLSSSSHPNKSREPTPEPMSPTYSKNVQSQNSVKAKNKKWKSPFRKSKPNRNASETDGGVSAIQTDGISADDFSNPFANSCIVDLAQAASAGVTGGNGTGQRSVPIGLYGTPNGPSSSRIARKKKRREEEMRLTKSFIVVIFVFILCWFPFCITMFWSVFIRDKDKSVPRPIDMATLLLGFANSCCNPIIYGLMNRKFRAGFRSLLCWWKDHNVVKPWKPPDVM